MRIKLPIQPTLEALKTTMGMVSTNETLPTLNGVCLTVADSKITAHATDRYRIGRYRATITEHEIDGEQVKIVIPLGAVKRIVQALRSVKGTNRLTAFIEFNTTGERRNGELIQWELDDAYTDDCIGRFITPSGDYPPLDGIFGNLIEKANAGEGGVDLSRLSMNPRLFSSILTAISQYDRHSPVIFAQEAPSKPVLMAPYISGDSVALHYLLMPTRIHDDAKKF